MNSSYMNWSGGKDSAFCLQKVLQTRHYRVNYLLTSVNATHDRISMHGVRRCLLDAQVRSIGIPLKTIELSESPTMEEYEACMFSMVRELRDAGCTHSIFGDIYLEDLRAYRERKLKEMGINSAFPLWHTPTSELIREFIESGFKAIIVCVNDKYLDKSYCGRIIDNAFLQDIPANVDPCGENGEFHSFVYEAPFFREPIPIAKGEIVYRTYQAAKDENTCHTPGDRSSAHGFYFCDLLPPNES